MLWTWFPTLLFLLPLKHKFKSKQDYLAEGSGVRVPSCSFELAEITLEGGKGRRGKKEGKVKSAPLQLKEKEERADSNMLNKSHAAPSISGHMFILLEEFKHFNVLICLFVCLFVWAGEMAQPLKAAVAIAKYLGLVSSIYLLAHNHCFRPSPDFCGAVHTHTYRQNIHTRTLRTNKSEKSILKLSYLTIFHHVHSHLLICQNIKFQWILQMYRH